MRIIVTALLGAIMMLGISCAKTTNGNGDATDRKFISMKMGTRIQLSENPKATVYLADPASENPDDQYPSMQITGTTYTGDYVTFTLAVPELPFKPGAYPVTSTGNSMTIYMASTTGETLKTDPAAAGFTINITQINSQFVEGTFSGTISGSSSGSTNVQDGTFRAVLQYKSR